MKLDKAINHQRQLISAVKTAVSMGRVMKETSTKIHARTLTIMRNAPKGLPRHVRDYVQGYIHALLDALWLEVEFCYRDAEGVIFSTQQGSTHRSTEEFYLNNKGHLLADMESAQLWKGTDKPYTEWSLIK